MAEIGGIVVLVEEPTNEQHQITRCVFYEDQESFIDALLELNGCKEVQGPLINGIWAVTFEGPFDRPFDEYCQVVQSMFDHWAKENIAAFGDLRPR